MLNFMHPEYVSKNKVQYVAEPSAFDIETTSFYDGDEKRATMYIWQFGYNGRATLGRTWPEFVGFISKISSQLDLNPDNRRMIVYIHNLGFEFQFLRKWFNWNKIFSVDSREPLFAITESGIEFRDSLILSGYSLAKLSEQLTKYKVRKMVGDLDYSLMRNCNTPITDKELQYCINDVLVVMAYIQELCEREGDIAKLPYTRTGFVRNQAKRECLRLPNHKRNLKFISKISSLTINDIEEFDMLRRAFQGGFTHANSAYSRQVMHNVGSYDFTSSYPTVMLTEQFPMSRGRRIKVTDKKQFEELLRDYCCVFDIELWDVHPKLFQDNPISYSKCAGVEDYVLNNGRIFSAAHLYTTITDVDYKIYNEYYSWSHFKVNEVMIYRRGYLPRELIGFIIELYKKKTQLKGVKGKETEYLVSKEMLNSTYGMSVTNPMKDENVYDTDEDEWKVDVMSEEMREQKLYEYNHDGKRFLFYPWGVFVTAYARRNLFTGITEFGSDFVYCDTDSIKAINWRDHSEYIDKYNKDVIDKCRKMCEHYGFDIEALRPKTINGVSKPIGVWDFEEEYSRFKTLGAKRYMIEYDGKINITVSGLNKKNCVPYLYKKYGDNDAIFNAFDFGMKIPDGNTGKLLHTYLDEPAQGNLVDYMGNSCDYFELSGTHLEPMAYQMMYAQGYVDFLIGVKERAKH